MWFRLDVNELSRNPRVYKVDERKIVLKTDFRIELYKLWRSGDPEGIQQLLDENGHLLSGQAYPLSHKPLLYGQKCFFLFL